jgi:hypothetical protein
MKIIIPAVAEGTNEVLAVSSATTGNLGGATNSVCVDLNFTDAAVTPEVLVTYISVRVGTTPGDTEPSMYVPIVADGKYSLPSNPKLIRLEISSSSCTTAGAVTVPLPLDNPKAAVA